MKQRKKAIPPPRPAAAAASSSSAAAAAAKKKKKKPAPPQAHSSSSSSSSSEEESDTDEASLVDRDFVLVDSGEKWLGQIVGGKVMVDVGGTQEEGRNVRHAPTATHFANKRSLVTYTKSTLHPMPTHCMNSVPGYMISLGSGGDVGAPPLKELIRRAGSS